MTDHHDDLRVAPDPSLAEELRQRLHARLATADQGLISSITTADTDPDEREGDLIMLETEDRPTGRPPTPGRHAPTRWLLVAAMVAVIAIVGAALFAAANDDDEAQVPATTPTTAPRTDMADLDGETVVPPGRYVVDPDRDPTTPLVVTFDIAADGWRAWSGTYKAVGSSQTAVNITTIENLMTEACTGHTPAAPPVGSSIDDLAGALAGLKPFEVPTDVTLLGYEGKHLQLRTPEDFSVNGCTGGHLESWIAASMFDGPFTGYNNGELGRTEDFWILDVNGQRIVIETNQGPSSTDQDLAEQQAIFDSIVIEP